MSVMIPGLDFLITRRLTEIGGSASQAKLQILDEANAAWIARGRPSETMNARIWSSLSGGAYGPSYGDLVVRDGASHYWTLNETSGLTAVDTIGGANGTISGGVTLGVPGALANGDPAMAFNGTTGKIQTAAGVTIPAICSIEAWVKVAVGVTGAHTTVSNRGLSTGPFVVFYLDASGIVGVASGEGSGLVGTRNLKNGLWHHVVTVIATGAAFIYIDGTLDTSSAFGRIASSTGPCALAWDSTFNQWWNGTLDNIALYPLALTAAQIRAHYLAALGAYAQRVVKDGASHYWRLGEATGTVAADLVGSAPGTISGGVTLGVPGAIPGDRAMAFNGTTGKIVTVATVPVLTPCSVEAWVRTTVGSGSIPIFSTPYSGTSEEWAVQLVDAYPSVNLSTAGQAQIRDISSPVKVTLSAWHHIVWTFQSAAVAVYVDGALAGSGTTPWALVGMTLKCEIGYRSDGLLYWNGSLDEVAIYPRALTAQEIAAHYALRAAPFAQGSYPYRVITDGASHYWRLNEATGTTATDLIGGAAGTISGGVTLNQPGALIGGDPAMAFNGATGKIVTTAAVSVPLACTIEGWVKAGAQGQVAICSTRGAGGTGHMIYAGIRSTHPYVYSNDGGGYEGTRVLTDGVWHHVVYVLSGTTCALYVDGAFDVTVPTGRTLPSTGTAKFAWDEVVGTNYLNGTLDDVAIYPRALTAGEVLAHYDAGRLRVRSINAGQPGTFLPVGAPVPTFAALQGMHPPGEQINPLSPWPVADWVVAAGGELCTWTGFDWIVKPSAFPMTGLVSYWKLDEASGTRVDSHGTNHLTPTNAPVGAAGKIGNGCDFESSSSQYLAHPDPAPLGDEDWTYVLWFKRESFGVGQMLIGKDEPTGRSYYLAFSISNTLQWFLHGVNYAEAVGPYTDTNWHFVVVWHDAGSDTVNIQGDNGAIATSGTSGVAPAITATPVAFGRRGYSGFEDYFDGLIDEVGLWRRVLTAQERTDLYNGGAGLTYPG